MRIAFAILVAMFCASFGGVPAHGQSSGAAQPTTPAQDPKALLREAAKVNGIRNDEVGPWRLKATFTLYDAMGNATDHGTYEEFWVNQKQSKSVVTSSSFSQVSYHAHGRWFSTGNQGHAPILLEKMMGGFSASIPEKLDDFRFTLEDRELGDHPVRCVLARPARVSDPYWKATSQCFDASAPIVMAQIDAFGIQRLAEHFSQFHGRYVARDVTIAGKGRLYLKAQVESLEEMPKSNPSEFDPPAHAQVEMALEEIFKPTSDEMRNILFLAKPAYPARALAAKVSGTVAVETIIDGQGHVTDAIAVGGPLELQDAAVNAVKQYCFNPFSPPNPFSSSEPPVPPGPSARPPAVSPLFSNVSVFTVLSVTFKLPSEN